MADVIGAVAALLMVLLAGIRWLRFRGHPWDIYYPKLAWLKASTYFCAVYLLAWATGALELVLTSALVTAEQAANPAWVLYTIACYLFILAAYAGVWSYFTPVFERQKNTLVSAFFGFFWGSCQGLLFISVWLLIRKLGLPEWGTWIATFLALGSWQPNFHNIWWDHYIAPEHDTPMTQKIKALGCHIPNLLVTLTYLTLYGNLGLFVSFQVLACMSAAIGMRYPAPWVPPSAMNYAKRTSARVPRCTGYIPADPLTDRYTPFYPGWKG